MRGERLQHAGSGRGDHRGRHDQPDQVACDGDIEQDAGAETAGNERGRAPHPHRTVGAADASEPAQRIGVGQRHDRRVEHRGEHERRRDGGGALGYPDHAVAYDRSGGRDHDRHAQGIVPVGVPGRERDREHAHDHRDRQHDSDHVGIEALRGEPDRQEGQLHAERDEQRGVKQRQPPRERRAGLE